MNSTTTLKLEPQHAGLRLSREEFATAQTEPPLTPADTFSTPLLPGLAVPLAEAFI